MTALLDARPLTDAEREAIADEERPGVWIEDPDGDGRVLSQEDTDTLIASELFHHIAIGDLVPIVGRPRHVTLDGPPGNLGSRIAIRQRGGIASEPLVRLLAFRAWGERDRAHDLAKLRASLDLTASIQGVSLLRLISDLRALGAPPDPLVAAFLDLIEARERQIHQQRREVDAARRAARSFAEAGNAIGALAEQWRGILRRRTEEN